AQAYPGYEAGQINRPRNLDQAVAIEFRKGPQRFQRLFHPYTGADLGDPVSRSMRAVSKLLALHDDLLGGQQGRHFNGIGALLLILLVGTGFVVWWPGIKTWKRGLSVRRGVGWRRFMWELHSMVGFWTLAFTLLFAVSGIYLSFPETFQSLADFVQP